MKAQSMWKMCRNKPIMQVRIIAVFFIQTEECMHDESTTQALLK